MWCSLLTFWQKPCQYFRYTTMSQEENQINTFYFIYLFFSSITVLLNNSSQNSLRNPFVQNFIRTQTGIDVAQMSSTLNQFCKFSKVWYMQCLHHGDASLLLQKVFNYYEMTSQYNNSVSHFYVKQSYFWKVLIIMSF